jgi:hypothetical protein
MFRNRRWPRRAGGRQFILTGCAAAAVALAACACSAGSGSHPAPTTATSGTSALAGAAPFQSAFASPSSKIAPINRLTGPPADPFAGTPADQWADGAAGIVVAAARAHGSFTAAQVQGAEETTKKLLAAAYLDRQTLLGGAPTAFEKLLTNQERAEFVKDLDTIGVGKEGSSLSTRALVTSFAPGGVKLIGSVIKVHGTMSARAGTDQGGTVLYISVNYLFVYAVEPPLSPQDWMRVVGHTFGTVEFGDWAQANTPFEPWVRVENDHAGIKCGARDGYVHPDFPNGPPGSVTPTGTPIDPYSQSTMGPGCQAITGT